MGYTNSKLYGMTKWSIRCGERNTQSEAFMLYTQPASPAFQESDTEYKPCNTDIECFSVQNLYVQRKY
jgi:hypothetical protein